MSHHEPESRTPSKAVIAGQSYGTHSSCAERPPKRGLVPAHAKTTPKRSNPAYRPAADPRFKKDITGQLYATFGGVYALLVEPYDGDYRCYIDLCDDEATLGWFTPADPRDILALAVSLENAVRLENGEPLSDGPFGGFMLHGQRIYNPFADLDQEEWLFAVKGELRHPRKTYGASYKRWLSQLVEARLRAVRNSRAIP